MNTNTVLWIIDLVVAMLGAYAFLQAVSLIRWQKRRTERHMHELQLLKALHADKVAALRETIAALERRRREEH